MFFLILIFFSLQNSKPVDIGGPRNVKGNVSENDQNYTVSIFFRPVYAFNEATNDEINNELAHEYAVRTLMAFLSNKETVQLSFAGEKVLKSKLNNNQFEMIITWPKSSLTVVSGTINVTKTKKGIVNSKNSFKNKFFTAKQDYLDILEFLTHRNTLLLNKLILDIKNTTDVEKKVYLRLIGDLEELGLDNFNHLAVNISKDNLLSDLTERPELLKAIDEARDLFLNNLKKAISSLNLKLKTPQSFFIHPNRSLINNYSGFIISYLNICISQMDDKTQFLEIKITPPYNSVILKNNLLMETGGVIIAERPGKTTLFIGISKTDLKKAGDNGEKIGKVKADALIVGEINGVNVVYTKEVNNSYESITDKSIEKRVKTYQEKVKGSIKGFPVVGKWKSSDGRYLYIAIGQEVKN
jgi:hypothetical protein